MKGFLRLQRTNLHLRSSPGMILCLGCLALILAPALACNLPPRQPNGLVFPTSQTQLASPTQPAQVDLPSSTVEGTPVPTLAVTPTSYPATAQPSEPPYPFWSLQTATPGLIQPAFWLTPDPGVNLPPSTYLTQPGDTLPALAARFGVTADQISPPQPATSLLIPGQQLTIPNSLGYPAYPSALLPDSAVVYSPLAASFDIEGYIAQAGGYLNTYRQLVGTSEWMTGPEVVKRVALQTSINPQVLLAFLEFRSGWVRGQPADPSQTLYPIGFYVPEYQGLYLELSLVAKQLNIGYYGWREGTLTHLTFPGNTQVRISPGLNAGSVGLQTLTSKFYRQQQDWLEALYGPGGFLELYTDMFGDSWLGAALVEPLFPPDLAQPPLELPFSSGVPWSLTAGPHIAWNTGTPRGGLDFAPITGEPACTVSRAWVTASAAGQVVRSGNGVVALDLDGDGLEQTGWVLVYMHIADRDRVALGANVEPDTALGHPSCEGGNATGTNVHLARKYNGEWLAADGPLPMVLSGWVAHADEQAYYGTLEKEGQVVSAHPDGSAGSTIIR
jgi:murein DD-endopeptidase MepM/ murein hydrolase activator NlpD